MKRLYTILTALLISASVEATTNEVKTLNRIVFVGDSIASGVGVKNRTNRFSTVTCELLKEVYPLVQEINLVKPGQGLVQQKSGYSEEVLAAHPDAVVIQWGVNDHFWGQSVANFIVQYDVLVHKLRESNRQLHIVVTTLIPDYRWDRSESWIAEANVAIQEIAVKYGCLVAYTHQAMDHNTAYYSDAIHPNEQGALQMANAIRDAFDRRPQQPNHFALQFDALEEARIQGYVFQPEWGKSRTAMIRISEITQSGMKIEGGIPLRIRTARRYEGNSRYLIRSHDEEGALISSEELTVDWSGVMNFEVKAHPALQILEIKVLEQP